MRTLFLNMTVSVDGYVAGPNGELDWLTTQHDADLTADAVSGLPTYVVSRTAEQLTVDNAELLVAADDAALTAAVTALKERPGRDLGLPGGVRTTQTFARLGLIDEYVFLVEPVALGAGQRVFLEPPS